MTPLTETEVTDSTRAFLEAVSVAPKVLELRPDYRVLVMVAEGLEPGPPDEISDELLGRAEIRARITLDGRAPEDVPQVADWRAAYRAFGAKPQRTRPSVEALLRRLDTGLPRIDRLTDAYNAVSIANLVPVGGEDLDQYQGPARLVRAAGDEGFDTMAHGERHRQSAHRRRSRPHQQETTHMLIHPWDGAINDTEWRDWLAGHDFGQLAVNDPDNGAPHVIHPLRPAGPVCGWKASAPISLQNRHTPTALLRRL